MGHAYQIPRNSLLWLMSAQAAVILPHLQHLSPWLVVIWLLVVVARVQIYRGVWSYPSNLIKAALIAGCLGSVLLGYGKLLGLEPMVALLISAFLLKLLEMQRRRDALLLLYLGYFVAATQFLFAQGLWATLYGVFTLVLLTTALLGLQQVASHDHWRQSLRLGTVLVMQALPLMLVLILLLPKIGALWSVPFQRNAAQTGISDSMSPGDFSELSRSSALAFRVRFDGDIPPRNQLYWRGLVFSRFDGRRWQQVRWQTIKDGPVVHWREDRRQPVWLQGVATEGSAVNYRVSLEPTQQPWLFALALVSAPPSMDVGLTRDFRLLHRAPVRRRLHYEVSSFPDYRLEEQGLTSWQREQETSLPDGFNPETRRRALRWWQETGTPQAYIDRVLGHFHDHFSYTLQPPLLGQHSVDEFLWQTQRGFCEHFASSFVVMMRAAGLPARVVVGYQGGEVNPLENYLMVAQSNAHAWAEVWMAERGWVRVDPTAAVAPERVEQSLENALESSERALLGSPLELFSYRHIAWLNQWRLQLDAFNYRWQTWVVGFDSEAQSQFLQRWLGKLSALKIALVFVTACGLVLGLVALRLLLTGQRNPLAPEVKYYRQFERLLAARGIERAPGEGVQAFAQRAAAACPAWSKDIQRISRLFALVAYRNHGRENRAALVALKKQVRRLRNKRFLRVAASDGPAGPSINEQ